MIAATTECTTALISAAAFSGSSKQRRTWSIMQSLSHGTLTLKGKNGNSHIAGREKIIQAPQVDLLGNCLSNGRR
jgi:hypothetical protein